jgi:predicted RNase H-like nuclease (RuvC/YqgF family)
MKTKEDIIASLTVGGYGDHGEYLYDAGEVQDAMQEYSDQQLSAFKSNEYQLLYNDYANHDNTIQSLRDQLAAKEERIDEIEETLKIERELHDNDLAAERKKNEELRAFLDEIVKNSNFPGANYTIPSYWHDKAKNLLK